MIQSNVKFRHIAVETLDWASQRNFLGSDPYDGLNSILFSSFLKHSKIVRLMLIQVIKRLPINLRKILLIPPGRNPKGLALFLSGLGYLPNLLEDISDQKFLIHELEQILLSLASSEDDSPAFSADREIRKDISLEEVAEKKAFGWGYNFPWQSKKTLHPAWSPTVVCSSFVLDAFHTVKSEYYPLISTSIAKFIIDNINQYKDDTGICFSYSANDESRVFNASLFAAKILARAIEFDQDNSDLYRSLAARACDYVVARQRSDGSWIYGEADHWQWVDNLHTGFVLETLNSISEILDTTNYYDAIAKGLEYYKHNLFENDWTAKYYSNSRYPLDPHSCAQAAITFIELSRFSQDNLQIAENILRKGIADLWNEKRQGFIYQKYPSHEKKMIYLRWGQGWMFKAICKYLGVSE